MRALNLLLIFIPAMVIGQDLKQVQDKAAEPFLDRISRDFDQVKPYQVEFRYEVYSATEDAKVSDYGSVIIMGNKYKLKTEDTEVYFNGKNLWSYSILNEEVYMSEPSTDNPDRLFTDPFRLLSEYRKYYKYRYMGEVLMNGTALQETDLYPADLQTNYSILKVFTDKKTGQLYSLLIKQKDGVEVSIYIRDIIKNIRISESAFSWNPADHPGVLLIEL